MDLYPWVVVAHVSLVILALGAHGVSAFAMFRVKRESDRVRLGAVLDLSESSLLLAGLGLLVAVILGIVAAVMGGHFSRLWPWASIVIVVIVFLAMTPMAANRMGRVRQALGMPTRFDKKEGAPAPRSDAELAAAQAALRPDIVGGLGVVAIILLVWLMETKPF